MSTSVKHIHHGMRGAPQISGTAGTLPAVLEALFVTGWGATTAVSVNVASGIATATLTPGETFDRDSVVLIAGGTPSTINGEARVLTSGNTSITWETAAPDGAATGTITIKYAPQTSWSKVYAATNKAVFRSTHVQSRGHYLRIDDTGTTTARARGYESMTDIDSGVGPFPTDVQMSGGGYLHKSVAASAATVRYRIFCDERFLIFAIAAGTATQTTAANAPLRGFGDPIELATAGDAWGTLLSVNAAGVSVVGNASFANTNASNANGMTVAARALSGLGSAVLQNNLPFTSSTSGISGADTLLGTLPSEVDGQVKMSRVFSRDQAAGKPPRSIVPGVFYIPQSGAFGPLAEGDVLLGTGDLAGHNLMVIPDPGNNAWSNAAAACCLVDITGPWR